MARTLAGMHILITGASAGIGAALARQLAAEGAVLALMARRRDRLTALAQDLGPLHLVLPGDVGREEDCRAAVDAAFQAWGRLDTLVCNAGYGLQRSVGDTATADWDAIWRTNLLGTAWCIQAALPRLRAQESRHGWRAQVMVVSSVLARRAAPLGAAYSATKAAQLSLCEALRVELAAERIAVTSVHPVGTDSDFAEAAAQHGGARWHVGRREPRQSTATVARAMVRGIRRPRAEVWPAWWARWAVALGTLLPGLADRAMATRLAEAGRGGQTAPLP
jgi:NAD(P)-dependent dehydrogenase (short-subunit alcohol dehydrogenase family)